MLVQRMVRRSYRRAGRLVPPSATRLRGRSMILAPAQAVDWHSTDAREELLIALRGTVCVERKDGRKRITTISLLAGQCAFLPCATRHRVVNRSLRIAHYLYVTA
ncbi:MAG: cupin domain-containing protein [Candidatus Omnitrophica bacterium]|nr:cupin domain-containing protein [Candidatus Omnitrophota bacterium]